MSGRPSYFEVEVTVIYHHVNCSETEGEGWTCLGPILKFYWEMHRAHDFDTDPSNVAIGSISFHVKCCETHQHREFWIFHPEESGHSFKISSSQVATGSSIAPFKFSRNISTVEFGGRNPAFSLFPIPPRPPTPACYTLIYAICLQTRPFEGFPTHALPG